MAAGAAPLHMDLAVAMLGVYDADGFIGVVPDAYGQSKAGVQPYELHSPHGFLSFPLDPDTDGQGNPGRGCTMLTALEGGRGHAWLSSDPRVVERLPRLVKGGSLLYGGPLKQRPSFALFDGTTGSYTLAVGYSFDGSGNPQKAHVFSADVRTQGSESVALLHGAGMGVTCTAGGNNSAVLRNTSGNAYYEANDDGLVANGAMKCNGSLAVGGTAALPVASAPAVLSALNILQAELASLAAIVAAIPGGAAASAGVAAGAQALASAVSTLTCQQLSST